MDSDKPQPEAYSDSDARSSAAVPAWTPANGMNLLATPEASPGNGVTPPAKRRREDRERSRVSRACDRCKK